MFDFVKEIETEILRCLKCGECQEVCPVYQDKGNESFVARGKIRLMRAVMNDEIELTPGIQERLDCCLNCNACWARCPAGIDTDELVVDARCEMRKAVLPVPKNLEAVRANIAKHGNPFGLPAEEREGWTPKGLTERQSEVGYFAGCAVSYSQNRMAKAALRVIEDAGIQYTTLGNEERCCGDPLLRMGLKKEAEDLLEKNRENFKKRGVKTIFTSCAGCAKALKHALGDEFEVLHVTEYLNKLAQEGKIEFEKPVGKKVTYMDGCDLGRHAKVYEAPRELLGQLPQVELVEMDYSRDLAACCGGPFVAAYPDLAKKFAANRIQDALDVGAEMIVVACPTCLLNMKEGAKAFEGVKIDIQEITSLVQKSAKREKK